MLNLLTFSHNFFSFLNEIISSFSFLLVVEIISFLLRFFLLIAVILHFLRSPKIQRTWFLLLPILISAMFANIAWIASLSRKLFFPGGDYRPVLFIIRLSLALAIIQSQALSLFIDNLLEKQPIMRWYQKIFLSITTAISLFFISLAILYFNSPTRPNFEITVHTVSSLCFFIFILPSIYFALKRVRDAHVPKILKKQFKILIKMLICPYLISDFIQLYPFSFYAGYIASNFTVVSISTMLLTFAFYFSAKKMMGLRFLNFNNHVQSSTQYHFIDNFKEVLEQLSHVTNSQELIHITQAFFKNAFSIQPSRCLLSIRSLKKTDARMEATNLTHTETIVEHFINRHEAAYNVGQFLRQAKIIITDEIAFNQFYDEQETNNQLLTFLQEINADIFIPIYERQTIIAYIIIERDARLHELYSNIERDEMVAFSSYLGNIINLLQHRNLEMLIQQEKRMSEELYLKHQEISQYKESIQSFLRHNHEQKIGILFYKNRHFVYGNQAAHELIEINLNTQDGHPLTKTIKRIAQQASEFRTTQTSFTKNIHGKKMILSAIPHLEENSIIVTVHYPEIADIIKMQLGQLQNPSEWDYLLYLETTKSGQLINQLIPGCGHHLINFKLELLKLALSKKALLLDMPEQDLMPTVEIIHHISLRQSLHILKLQSQEKNNETAIKLFGINPIFGIQQESSLLERLDTVGTLFIQNIHFLDLETQRSLAQYLQYGYFHIFKSDQKIISNVRIICSSNQNLQLLAQDGKFSKELYQELNETKLSLPSLFTLPEKEISELVDGFTEQALKTETFKNLLDLTDKEKDKLVGSRPVSLQEFKMRIHDILTNKSKKNNIYEETQFDPAYNVSDPELAQAARMGKKALKDQKIMTLLWQKFKNQNKIATFLGVNRSSVNRRCKEYNLDI